MPCGFLRNEPIIILKVQMRIAGKIMLFNFAGDIPDDCVITAHRDPHKCLAVGYGGNMGLPNSASSPTVSALSRLVVSATTRLFAESVRIARTFSSTACWRIAAMDLPTSSPAFLLLFSSAFSEIFSETFAWEERSVLPPPIRFRYISASARPMRGDKSTNGEGKPISPPVRRLRAV